MARVRVEGVVSDTGDILDVAGACVVRSGGGDTYWYWWRATESGTDAGVSTLKVVKE